MSYRVEYWGSRGWIETVLVPAERDARDAMRFLAPDVTEAKVWASDGAGWKRVHIEVTCNVCTRGGIAGVGVVWYRGGYAHARCAAKMLKRTTK